MSTTVLESLLDLPVINEDDPGPWHIARYEDDRFALCGHEFKSNLCIPVDEIPLEDRCPTCESIADREGL